MATYSRVEVAVGAFVLLGLALVGWLSVTLGDVRWFAPPQIEIGARFATVGDLKQGAPVKLAGVKVGDVRSISLDNYAAEVRLVVDVSIELPKDTIASIRTSGLLGESYVSLSPGAHEANLGPGDRITRTEPPLDIMELVGKYAFGSGADASEKDDKSPQSADPFDLE